MTVLAGGFDPGDRHQNPPLRHNVALAAPISFIATYAFITTESTS